MEVPVFDLRNIYSESRSDVSKHDLRIVIKSVTLGSLRVITVLLGIPKKTLANLL